MYLEFLEVKNAYIKASRRAFALSLIHIFKNYPGIELLDSQPADFNREKGMTVMENFLQRYPEIDGVGSINKDMTMGAIEACKAVGRDKDVYKRQQHGHVHVFDDGLYRPVSGRYCLHERRRDGAVPELSLIHISWPPQAAQQPVWRRWPSATLSRLSSWLWLPRPASWAG